MNHTDMADKDEPAANRIPVRFFGDEDEEETGGGAPGELTPEELGRASIYEDATEMQRRIDRGGEGDAEGERERADDEDVAGTVDRSELEESRTDLDTRPPLDSKGPPAPDGPGSSAADEQAGGDEQTRKADAAGPAVAELVATRAELRRVEAELRKLRAERDDLSEKLVRRQADFDNFRKRTERERHETYQRALGDVVGRFLPALDNFQRALDAQRALEARESEEFRHLLHGVELINKQLGGVLESLGVETVPTVGHSFDPHVHEAVAAEESGEHAPDTVMEELQRGYRLGEKLLRPAMVKVAKQ
ncbi:MAG TPA: nucleotide exchange factor GrpE [Pyrinomonadaceae bacterium]|nr:nucleotide exchange factor GrpE [Pyrinomonadaceae bacterium]